MNFEEIELSVAKKETFLNDMPLEEIACYSSLRLLYLEYNNKLISRKEAAKKRQSIKQSFLKSIDSHSRQKAAYYTHQEFIRKAATYRPTIIQSIQEKQDKNKTILLMAECISTLCQDSLFLTTINRLINNQS